MHVNTLFLERLGKEKMRVERGAAIRVMSKDPTNNLNRNLSLAY